MHGVLAKACSHPSVARLQFTKAVEAKQVAQQDAERARFVVMKADQAHSLLLIMTVMAHVTHMHLAHKDIKMLESRHLQSWCDLCCHVIKLVHTNLCIACSIAFVKHSLLHVLLLSSIGSMHVVPAAGAESCCYQG